MQAEEKRSIKEFELINVDINSIELDSTNPNIMTKEQMAAMRKSMQQYGYLVPVILDRNNKICDGEHRVLIYKELGLSTIPAYKVDLDSDTDRKQLRQIMNKLHGFHDKAKDAAELLEILQHSNDGTLQQLSELIAQPREDLETLVLRYNPGLEFVTPENEQEIDKLIDEEMQRISPDTQLGDLYQLGNHKLACGDCTDDRVRKKLFGENPPDIILTDPPYSSGGFQEAGKNSGSIGTRQNVSIRNDVLSTRGYLNLIFDALTNVNADILYLFTDWRMWVNAFDVSERCGFRVRAMIVWDKESFGMGYPWRSQHELILHGRRSSEARKETLLTHGNVIQCKRTGNVNHPVEKPVELLTKILRNTWDGTVYDPFAGSGSTLIASEQTNRICYACDIDPRYCDITVKRWEKYTGKKAVKQ